jgi:hypothetical protein
MRRRTRIHYTERQKSQMWDRFQGHGPEPHESNAGPLFKRKSSDGPQLSLSQNTSTASRFMMPHMGVPSRTRPVRMR